MFDEIVREWLNAAQRRPDLAASTKVEYARIGAHLLAWQSTESGGRVLSDYVAARRQAGVAPRTVALELRVLSVATRWAERHLGQAPPPVLPKVRIDPKVFVLNHRTPTPREMSGTSPRGSSQRRVPGSVR